MVNSARGGSTDDQLGPAPRAQRLQVSQIVASANNLIESMYSDGEDAEASFRTALEELRGQPDEAVIALARLEGEADRRAYPRRWALIYAATQLEHDAMLPFLRQVVSTPIPPEESLNPHSFSTVGEETVLRTTAIEAVGVLAARGNERAREALFAFLSIDSISMRRACVQSLLAIDRGLRDRITQYLPPEFRYLLDIRPVTVTDVPQVKDPQLHLSERRPREKAGPPEAEASDGPYDQTGPRTGG